MRIVARMLTAVAAATVLLVMPNAIAEVANRYGGQVILFSSRPPSSWRSDNVFHNFVRQNRISNVAAGDDGNWDVEYMAFFRRPVDDREVQVLFYDIHDGYDRFINSYSLYLMDPGQRVVGGSASLERPDFRPNRYYSIRVTSRQQVIARLDRFALTGDEPERTGRVDFSVEDTRGP